MTLSKREKRLAIAVGGFGVPLALWLLYGLICGDIDILKSEIAVHRANLEKFQEQVIRGKKAQDRMAQWNRQALPSDSARAGSLYKTWLLEIAGKAGFRQKKVEPGEVRSRGDVYQQLPFTVRGQATLDELVKFLYEFYSAGHLHQIRRLMIRPSEKSKDLDLVITIEALSLPKADRKDELSKEPGKRLALGSLEEYRKAIAGRNVLAPYQPPVVAAPAPRIEPGPRVEPFDASKFAFVTGIVEVNGKPQVWVKARTTDEKFQLYQGDGLQIGPFQATIARINPRDVEIEVQGQRHTIPLGGSVRGGEGETKPAEPGEPRPPTFEPKSDGERRGPGEGDERRDRSRRRRDYGGSRSNSGEPMPMPGGPGPMPGGAGSEGRPSPMPSGGSSPDQKTPGQ